MFRFVNTLEKSGPSDCPQVTQRVCGRVENWILAFLSPGPCLPSKPAGIRWESGLISPDRTWHWYSYTAVRTWDCILVQQVVSPGCIDQACSTFWALGPDEWLKANPQDGSWMQAWSVGQIQHWVSPRVWPPPDRFSHAVVCRITSFSSQGSPGV